MLVLAKQSTKKIIRSTDLLDKLIIHAEIADSRTVDLYSRLINTLNLSPISEIASSRTLMSLTSGRFSINIVSSVIMAADNIASAAFFAPQYPLLQPEDCRL